ncbi:MAG: RluA family pseudouridine synthase [Clostridia bacterium]|nr:RluA family pseudouridine synthase [Clostridia bacterium]
MKTFTITANDAGQRLDKFIAKCVPALPKTLMYKYLRTKRIKRNGKKAEFSVKLAAGDVIDMYISDEFFGQIQEKKYDFLSAPKSLDIVYEDENIMILNKKAGVLCHPDNNEYVDTLVARVKRYLYEKGKYKPEQENSFVPSLANRIDRNTGGLVLAAKNAEALRVLNQKIKDRELTKLYMCIAIGEMPKTRDLLTAYLRKDSDKNKVFITNKEAPDSRIIKTEYTVLDYRKGVSLLQINLLTGRTHQIRAHLAHIGHPLLGDGKYGRNEQNKKLGGYKKQCLYSYSIRFDFTTDAGILSYLNGKSFSTDDIWFKTAFYNDDLF